MDLKDISKLGKKKVKECVMPCSICFEEDTPLEEIIDSFKGSILYSFPVNKKNGEFLGVIYKSELLKLIIPESFSTEDALDEVFFGDVAKDFLKYVPTVSPEATLESAAFLMYKHEIITVPVIKDKKFQGFITERDIVEQILKRI